MTSNQNSETIYHLHQTALKPLLPDSSGQALIDDYIQIKSIGETRFLNFLHNQGLAAMWHKTLSSAENTPLISDNFMESLHRSRLQATGTYMLQSQALKKIKSTLDNENINHVVFKGCHIREVLYDEPAVRPACDIDVLISPNDQEKTIQALVNAGYQFVPNPENISHEATLFKGDISIDLHWDIMRPGRTRIPMTETLLTTREEFPNHWGLSNEATLFLMLVHPVFTKYSTTPHASIMRSVDLAYWINQQELNWEQLLNWLEDTGLKTAAWITLKYLQILTGIMTPRSFSKQIQPRKLTASYLSYWIKQNFSSKFLDRPLLIQLAFTLPAHDKLSDAINAVKISLTEKRTATLKSSHLADAIKSVAPK